MTPNVPRRGPITAGELLDRLERDPAYQAHQRELARRRAQALEEYLRIAAPVLDELAAAGLAVPSVGALVEGDRDRWRKAVPILLRWLPLIDDPRVKEDIVRTLTVKWAKPSAAAPLIQEFTHAPPAPGLKWAIGNALSIVADDSVFDDLVALLRDKRHGDDRQMLAEALSNIHDPRAVDVAIEMLDDEDVAGHALMALGKLKASRARPAIERFLTHPRTWWRNAAKQALARIEKAERSRSAGPQPQ